MRVLPARIPVFYLMLMMHLRLGLIDPETQFALTVEDTLDRETLFLLTPLLFGMGLIPEGEGVRFDKPLPGDAISIANAYQSYIGQTLGPDGKVLRDKSQTYFSLPGPGWIPYVMGRVKEANPESELTEELLFTETLRFQLEWLAYGSRGAFEHLGKREAGEMVKVYGKVKQAFYDFYGELRDEAGEPLLKPEAIGLIMGERDPFDRSGGTTPYRLDEAQARPVLEKLRTYFLTHVGGDDPHSLVAYQELAKRELMKLRETYYRLHPEARSLFEAAFLTGLPPSAAGMEEGIRTETVEMLRGMDDASVKELAAQMEAAGAVGAVLLPRALVEAARPEQLEINVYGHDSVEYDALMTLGVSLTDTPFHYLSLVPDQARKQIAGIPAGQAAVVAIDTAFEASLGNILPAEYPLTLLIQPDSWQPNTLRAKALAALIAQTALHPQDRRLRNLIIKLSSDSARAVTLQGTEYVAFLIFA